MNVIWRKGRGASRSTNRKKQEYRVLQAREIETITLTSYPEQSHGQKQLLISHPPIRPPVMSMRMPNYPSSSSHNYLPLNLLQSHKTPNYSNIPRPLLPEPIFSPYKKYIKIITFLLFSRRF